MTTIRLGRTELLVSVAGLGTGGASRIGQGRGRTQRESLHLLEQAFSRGVNYVDTAPGYGTERLVGTALSRLSEPVYVSTKVFPGAGDHPIITEWGGQNLVAPRPDASAPLMAADLRAAVENSLAELAREAIDVYHVHAVAPDLYPHVVTELVPEMLALRDEGKIRFLGISEFFPGDPSHTMLTEALRDDCWDVCMLGFNLFNPSAREGTLAIAAEADVGVEVMAAARGPYRDPAGLRDLVRGLVEAGLTARSYVSLDNPLGFLIEHGASSLTDAAYRFARHQPGCHVVLTGTSSEDHLEANLRSINAGPLPPNDLVALNEIFGRANHLSLGHG